MARYSPYPQIKVDEALLAYYTLGTYDKAGEATSIPPTTIKHWVNVSHTERYDELAAKHGPTLERQVVAKLARTADKAVDRVDQALDATGEAISHAHTDPPKREDFPSPEDHEAAFRIWANLKADASKNAQAFSNAAKNAALVLGIATDKKLTLEGRPTVITEHRDAEDILKALSTVAPGLVIDSTADEIPTTPHRLNTPAEDPIPRALRRQPSPNARDPQPA